MRAESIFIVLAVTAVVSQQPSFEAVQPDLFKQGGGLTNAWADFDLDGDLDLFVGFGGTPNRLYRNAAGKFSDVAPEFGVADARATRAAAWGDYDGDGDADLFIGFAPGNGSVLRLYRNDRTGFVDVSAASGLVLDSAAVRQPSWVDYDADGDLDLFLALRDKPNKMYRNDAARFRDIAAEIGLADPRKSVGAVWFDYDQDGDLDLYVANQDGDANGLFRNEQGRFTDVAEAAGAAWGGRPPGVATNGTVRPCVGDVNNDGLLDLFLANYGPNGLLLNRGGGRFNDVSESWGVAIDGRHDTCAFADFDQDGRLDVYVNGTFTANTSYRDFLWRNTGAKFEDVTPPNILALNASHGAQWADFDNDGDLDLALAGTRPDMPHALLRNQLEGAPQQRWLSVAVIDERGHARRAGVEIKLYAAGTNRVLGTRIVDTGSGYNSQDVLPVHFGLPDLEPVDVEVAYAAGRRVSARFNGIKPQNADDRRLEIQVPRDGTPKLARAQKPRM